MFHNLKDTYGTDEISLQASNVCVLVYAAHIIKVMMMMLIIIILDTFIEHLLWASKHHFINYNNPMKYYYYPYFSDNGTTSREVK